MIGQGSGKGKGDRERKTSVVKNDYMNFNYTKVNCVCLYLFNKIEKDMSFAAVYYSVLEIKLTVLCIHRDIDWYLTSQ